MPNHCTLSQTPRWLLVSILSFFLLCNVNRASADGADIFKKNCAVCHTLTDKKSTGPGLLNVMDRVPGEDWLKKWIKNSGGMIASGDAYAVKIFAENDKAQMSAMPHLSDADLTELIAYLASNPGNKLGTPTPGAPTGDPGVQTAPVEEGLSPLNVTIFIVIFLAVLIAVLRRVKHSLRNVVNKNEGLPESDPTFTEESKSWIKTNRHLVAVIVIFLTLGGVVALWQDALGIGVYQGYKPEQPINFSHKIHAGDNAIACQYCHSGVERGKTAGIPSVNVCMNCHKGISEGPTKEGPKKGSDEIAKIYAAAGFDPKTMKYDADPSKQHPIKWVKVHNLPDFVYFNHSQHVVVGKQACENCHGDVKKMTAAEQFSPLTMGWCVDCHRKTEVPGMKDNPYYEELHKKLAAKYGKKTPLTVEKMGGLECGKCHY